MGIPLTMTTVLLLGFGGAVIVVSVVSLIRDCAGAVSASMGGEMFFSGLWTIGAMLLSLGALPLLDLSRWWTPLCVALLFTLSFPLRGGVQKLFCRPLPEEPSGFKQFVRRTESKRSKPR